MIWKRISAFIETVKKNRYVIIERKKLNIPKPPNILVLSSKRKNTQIIFFSLVKSSILAECLDTSYIPPKQE